MADFVNQDEGKDSRSTNAAGYDRQDFIVDQILTADNMNHIESGIINNETAINNNRAAISANELEIANIKTAMETKQDKLVDGENIKTINGNSFLGSGDINIETDIIENGKSYIHFSFDDVTSVISALAAGNLNSIYDNSFLAMLKNMHDTYGFVFSLYIQSAPSSISTKHQAELQEASSWLKWGLHALNGGNYQSSTYDQGKADWNKMVDAILKLTGTHNAIDRIPRLHQFYGSENALRGMRDAKLGAKGFLSTDDTRNAYYLSKEKLNYLYEGENDHLTDFKNSLVFYRTDLRLDWFSGAGFTYNAAAGMSNHTPADNSDIAGELERRFNDALYINTWNCYVIFTHEWQPQSAIKNALVAIGEFAKNHNIPFDFPQNNHAYMCQGDINVGSGEIAVDSALSSTSVNPVQNKVINSKLETLSSKDATLTSQVNSLTSKNTNLTSRVETLSSELESLLNMDTILASYINALERRIAVLESAGDVMIYTVKNVLTNVTTSNISGTVIEGDSYSATLTANNDTGFIDSVTVTMGGTDITSSVFSNDVIFIENVTGNIVITASAIATVKPDVPEEPDTPDVPDTPVDPIGTYKINGRDLDIVTSAAQMEYTINKTLVGGGATNVFNESIVGRAVSYTTILKVNGGDSITLNQVINGTTLTYALRVFKDTNCTGASSESNFIADAWISTSVTLPSAARYVLIAFKKGDGSASFTEEEAKLLSNALTIDFGAVVEPEPEEPTPEPEEPEVLSNYTFKNGKSLPVVENFADIEWLKGISVQSANTNTDTNQNYPHSTTVGRAAANQVLKVNGGETVTLTQVVSGLAYAMTVWSDGNNTTASTQSNMISGAWLTTNMTLPSSARYILFSFKNGDGSTEFTQEQIQLLSSALTIK
jgi:hypothetical protein